MHVPRHSTAGPASRCRRLEKPSRALGIIGIQQIEPELIFNDELQGMVLVPLDLH